MNLTNKELFELRDALRDSIVAARDARLMFLERDNDLMAGHIAKTVELRQELLSKLYEMEGSADAQDR